MVTQAVCDKNGKNIVIATNFGVVVGVSFTLKPALSEVEGLPYKKEVPFQNNLTNEQLKNYELVLETYNSATGYPVKDVNSGQNCLLQDSKGIYWAGTGSDATALLRMDFNALNRNPKPPTPLLYNIKLNEENICYYSLSSLRGTKQSHTFNDSTTLAQQEIITYGKTLTTQERGALQKQFAGIEFDGITKFYPIPQNLVLPYEHNNVTFEFNAVQLSRSHLLNFQYTLEGYDKAWSPVLKKREATFGNISEGTYTFKLKAQYTGPDGNNTWSEVLSYTFKVLPPWYRTWWMYTVYIILAITCIAIIIWANSKRLRAKAVELKQKVIEATNEITKQKNVIEEKHKEITDSINYAERIQRSLLASKELLNENLNRHSELVSESYDTLNQVQGDNSNYFVFFKPKDVVSGDFYWASKLSNGQFALITADSTGHGVPGAIMSILNIACLNEAIKEGIYLPDEILNHTRTKIIDVLKRDGSAEGGKDGMDASLICFEFPSPLERDGRVRLTYAAANNPVWVVRSHSPFEGGVRRTGDVEFISLPADRMPVGKHDKDSVPFTQHEFELQTGDMVYTLTDGFPDQFGGPKGKKFKYKQLEELLISIAHESMEIQKQKLNAIFENWKGNLEQVDDVCVIGVRI